MVPPQTRNEAGPRHAVLMGCGRIGASIAVELSDEGWTVHILDTSPDAFERIPPGKVEQGAIVPIVGDGMLESDLRRADIEEASVFIAVSGRDTRNALAAQLAKHVLEVPRVICRMNDPVRKEMYDRLGLVAISATRLVTEMALEAARQ